MTDHPSRHDLAAWIRAARRRAGLSQGELADQLGIRQASVSQWERGTTQPSTQHLLALVQELGSLSLADLTATPEQPQSLTPEAPQTSCPKSETA